MKKLLILGAGSDQAQAINIARSMGYYVLTTDRNPEAPGVQLADKFCKISTNDLEKTLAFAQKEKVNGITTVASENSIPVIARVAEKMNLPGIGYETAIAATNKIVMKRAFVETGADTPAFREINAQEELQEFIKQYAGPWVIKPSNCSGQRGITFFRNPAELKKYYKNALEFATDGKVIIEQFIEGPEINICASVNDGRVKFLSLSDRITDPYKNFGIAVRHLVPARLNQEEKTKIEKLAIAGIRAIKLNTGIAYPQVIMGKNGPQLIEIAARMPGGKNREIAMYHSGIDMIRVAILQALGIKFTDEEIITEEIYPATAVRFITRNDIDPGISEIREIYGLEDAREMKGIKEVFIYLKTGQKIPALTNSTARFGGIIAVGNSREDAMNNAEEAFKKIIIN